MNPVLRWAIIVVFILWLTLITILGISYGLLSTTGGSRWLLEKIDSSVETIELSWQEIDGSLMQGLEFRDLALSVQGTRLEAGSFSVQWDLFDLMQAEMALSELRVLDMRIQLAESSQATEVQPWPSISLPVAFTLDDARIENLEIIPAGAGQSQVIDLLMFSGGLRSDDLRIAGFTIEQQNRGVELTGRVELSPPYRLALDIQWHTPFSRNDETIEIAGAAQLSGNLAELSLDHQLRAPLPLTTVGKLETGFDENVMGLAMENLAFELENVWAMNNVAVPTQDIHLTSTGEMNLVGNLQASHIDSRLNVHIPEIGQLPQQQIEFSADIQGNRARLNQLLIETGFGRISGDGNLHWGELSSWVLSLQLTDIDPGYFVAEVPGAIQATLSSSGEIQDGSVQTQLQIDRLEGQIRGFPLSGSGGLAYQDNQAIARNLLVRAGDNQLVLNANLGSELDLSWNLAASKLSQLYPGLDGTLNLTGTAAGQIDAPKISARLFAESIGYQGISVEEIQANIRGSKEAGRTLNLSISNFAKGSQSVDLQLDMEGTLDRHEYDLQLSSELLTEAMSANITGVANYGGTGSGSTGYGGTGSGGTGSGNRAWQTDIEELMLDLGFAGQWTLDSSTGPAAFFASTNRVVASPFCLSNSGASICTTEALYDTGEINLAARLSRIQLELFNEFLPQDVRISGDLSGEVNMLGPVDQLEGNLALDAPEIILTITQLQKTEFHRINANRLSGQYENNQLDLTLASELSDNGLIDGDLQVGFGSGEQSIDGRLEARFSELTWLDPFLPQLSDLDGDTNIDISLNGTLQNPVIGGDMHIANLTAFVPETGILLEQGRIDLVNRGAADWDLSASMLSGEGELEIDGQVTLTNSGDWNIEVTVRGDEFNAYALGASEVFVSPDLDLKISPRDVRVTGDMLLPRASLVIKSLPASTVKVSRDEVVVSEQAGSESQAQQGPSVTADVNLLLGDQVQFEGFNILGRLTGQLRLRESPGVPQRIEGSIEILDGTYSAYGQELTIDPGQLIFNGSAENPRLNVRAYRTVDTNLVGVHLGGTVETLSSTLYSAPGLPQTEILSLLVTGKSLSNTTSSEGGQLVSALTSLGIAQSSLITESLQNTLNLDVLEISASEDIEDSSVTIGKYLSPKLFLSYAQDILTPESSVSLDYFLSEKVKINAQSGGAQSMDIFYRIERCPDC